MTDPKRRRESLHRYNHSEKGHAARRRYNLTEQGRAVHREAQRRHGQTEKKRAAQARYHKSEKGRAAQARYRKSEKGSERQARYAQTKKGRATRARHEQSGKTYAKSYATRLRHPEKLRARSKVHRAVRAGRLQRPQACPACGRVGPVQAHHSNYAAPLDVVWLCRGCHDHAHGRAPRTRTAPRRNAEPLTVWGGPMWTWEEDEMNDEETMEETTAEETATEEGPKTKRQTQRRGHLKHPVDRFFELIDAVERGDGLVDELHLKRTDPGWTLRVELHPEDGGHPRETMHYDSPNASVGELFRSIMNEFAAILLGRAREAEDELLRCRSAIVRSLPPSERQPVTTRRRRVRRTNGSEQPRRRRRAAAPTPAPEPEAPITDGP